MKKHLDIRRICFYALLVFVVAVFSFSEVAFAGAGDSVDISGSGKTIITTYPLPIVQTPSGTPAPLPPPPENGVTATPDGNVAGNTNDSNDGQESVSSLTITGFLGQLSGILNRIIPFIIGLTVFIILWGIFTYITHAAEEEKRAEARQFIIWGIIGVFFMLSIWGFVNLLLNSFDIERDIQTSDIPKVPTIVNPSSS